MSFTDVKRQGYRLQRAASLGATVTLVSGCGVYTALFECASRCAEVLGTRGQKELGDGDVDHIPSYPIPTEELHLALQKLTKRFSVALVEYVCQKDGGRFVPLCRINPATPPLVAELPADNPKPSYNLDEF